MPAAQAKKVEKQPFTGIWQMAYVVRQADGHRMLRHLPVWKVLGSDGRFEVMLWRDDDVASIITTSGTYRLVNDSIAAEVVEHAATAPKIQGTQTVLKYEFVTPDLLFVRYWLQGSEEEAQELWSRVGAVQRADLVNIPTNEPPARRESRPQVVQDTAGIYLTTEVMPEFVNGGHEGFVRYLSDNIAYPQEAQEKGFNGVSLISFVINEKGETEDFHIIKSATALLDAEVIRVLRAARFHPGLHAGKPVKVYSTVPVTFKLHKAYTY